MQVHVSQNPNALSGSSPLNRQTKPEQTAPRQEATKPEKALTVAISPEALALQKQAEARKAARLQESEKEQSMQQPQPLQAQGPEGKAGQRRIDLSV